MTISNRKYCFPAQESYHISCTPGAIELKGGIFHLNHYNRWLILVHKLYNSLRSQSLHLKHSVTLKSLEQYNKEPIMSVKLLVHWTLELRNILRGSPELFMNIASSHSVECQLNGFQKKQIFLSQKAIHLNVALREAIEVRLRKHS